MDNNIDSLCSENFKVLEMKKICKKSIIKNKNKFKGIDMKGIKDILNDQQNL